VPHDRPDRARLDVGRYTIIPGQQPFLQFDRVNRCLAKRVEVAIVFFSSCAICGPSRFLERLAGVIHPEVSQQDSRPASRTRHRSSRRPAVRRPRQTITARHPPHRGRRQCGGRRQALESAWASSVRIAPSLSTTSFVATLPFASGLECDPNPKMALSRRTLRRAAPGDAVSIFERSLELVGVTFPFEPTNQSPVPSTEQVLVRVRVVVRGPRRRLALPVVDDSPRDGGRRATRRSDRGGLFGTRYGPPYRNSA
jgi:hypothetical protein